MSLKRGKALLGYVIAITALAVAGAVPASSQGARPDSPAPDRYGYSVFDQDDPECRVEFVDIGVSGESVAFTPSGAEPADDDGGAVIALGGAFELFGEPVTSLVMSSNGYLGVASTLEAEDGGDFSNDARLPAIPGNANGVPARLFVFHDELSGFLSGGSAHSRHFTDCPRLSEALGSEACTVFQWTDWSVPTGGEPFQAQAIVYHDSYEIVFQARPGATPLRGGTIGIQNAEATLAVQYRDTEFELSRDTAICFLEPRYPAGGPSADLEITKTDKVDQVASGETLTYAVALINHGPSPVVGARVNDSIPSSLVDCTWTCESSEDSTCTAAGDGDIDDLVDLFPGGWVDYRLTCDVGPAAVSVVNTATVESPTGVGDPDLQNNSASDVDGIANAVPDCSAATATPDELWPPDHKFVAIAVTGVSDPDGDPVTLTIDSVFQDEPVLGIGSGSFVPDCRGVGADAAQVRSEREGPGNGRVYHIGFSADDGRGGACSGEVVVGVPSSLDPYVAPVDDGSLYDSCVGDPNRRRGPRPLPHRTRQGSTRNPQG